MLPSGTYFADKLLAQSQRVVSPEQPARLDHVREGRVQFDWSWVRC